MSGVGAVTGMGDGFGAQGRDLRHLNSHNTLSQSTGYAAARLSLCSGKSVDQVGSHTTLNNTLTVGVGSFEGSSHQAEVGSYWRT